MEIGKLTVQSRDHVGKGVARQLRLNGFVPGVCYGAGMAEPLKIVVDPRALKASLDPQRRRNTVIQTSVQANGKELHSLTTMLWDYQIDPIKRVVTHVDLKAIDPNKAVVATVPVELVGKAKGLVNGGQLASARHEIEVSAKPADIPVKIEADVSDLDLGDVLHVSDLVLPAGVELVSDKKLTIVTCNAPKTHATDQAAEAAAEAAAAAAAAEKDKKPAAKADAKKEGE